MFGNIIKQQKIKCSLQLKETLFFTSIIFLISLSNVSTSTDYLILFTTIFNRYLWCMAFFPIVLLAILIITDYKINDFFFAQIRSVLFFQIILQSVCLIIFFNLVWLSSLFLSAIIFNHYLLQTITSASFVLSLIYANLVSYFLVILALCGFLVSNSKVFGFLLSFIIDLVFFSIYISKKLTLFFYFTFPNTSIDLLTRLSVLVGMIIFGLILLYLIILRKEF